MKLLKVRLVHAVNSPTTPPKPETWFRAAVGDESKTLSMGNALYEISSEGPWVTVRNRETGDSVMTPMVNVIEARPLAEPNGAKK